MLSEQHDFITELEALTLNHLRRIAWPPLALTLVIHALVDLGSEALARLRLRCRDEGTPCLKALGVNAIDVAPLASLVDCEFVDNSARTSLANICRPLDLENSKQISKRVSKLTSKQARL